MASPPSLDDYRRALATVTAACGDVVSALPVSIEPPRVDVRIVEPGHDIVSNDQVASIAIHVCDIAHLRPPPRGLNIVYGTCHEVGHLVVSSLSKPHPLPPVVWDEALAHLLAVDLFLPAVAELAPGFWPGTPDWSVRDELAATEQALLDGHYAAVLDHQVGQLRRIVSNHGLGSLLDAVGACAPQRASAPDWLRRVRNALAPVS